jgi:GT2 family glycosyltransferase
VLVLGYRARSFLEQGSLHSIVAATAEIEGEARVVYLDNYSRDGSIQWISQHCSDVDLLLAPTNTLYCVGTNILLQYAHHRYSPGWFILVDADNFVDAHTFRELCRFVARHARCGLVQPLVRSRDGDGIYSCGHHYTADHWCRPLTALPEERDTLLDLPSCSISSTLVRAEVFEQCGLLNPIFDMYYESSDLSFRARRAGFTCACHPDAVSYNEPTRSPGPDAMHSYYYFNRNRLIFWRLHDTERFGLVRADAIRQLTELEHLLSRSPFGLDAERESIRRGLTDGLSITANRAMMNALPPRIDSYVKTSAVLLQEGRVL